MGAATARFLERPQAFARAVGVHAMAFAAFAVALGVGTFTVPRLGERAAVGLLGAALVLALCAVAWNARRRAPLRAGATAVAALALLLGSGASTGAGWREPRYVKAAFARRVGALVGAQTPIVSFAGDQELFVYYTDRPIPRLSLKEPDALEALGPETLVLCTRSRLESGALRGTTVLSEEPLPDRDPLLLVAPERSQTPGAFADEQAPGTAAAPAR